MRSKINTCFYRQVRMCVYISVMCFRSRAALPTRISRFRNRSNATARTWTYIFIIYKYIHKYICSYMRVHVRQYASVALIAASGLLWLLQRIRGYECGKCGCDEKRWVDVSCFLCFNRQKIRVNSQVNGTSCQLLAACSQQSAIQKYKHTYMVSACKD